MFWCATMVFEGPQKGLQEVDNRFDRFDRADHSRINKGVDFNLNDDCF
jgi:hypothetical protein